MFNQLVESGRHTTDLKRKGRFFLGTLALYCMLLVLFGVGSIYAYHVQLAERPSDYELLAVMRFAPERPREAERREPQRATSSARATQQIATRSGEISIQTPYHGDRVAKDTTKEIKAGVPVVISNFNSDPVAGGLPPGPDVPGTVASNHGHGDGPVVSNSREDDPPPLMPRPTPPPAPVEKRVTTVSLGVINGRAISKPVPFYPPFAKAAHVSGVVTVQILVDEEGRVVSARATNGPLPLQPAAVAAAYQARFSPTLLSRQPVKVSGLITYNFMLQ